MSSRELYGFLPASYGKSGSAQSQSLQAIGPGHQNILAITELKSIVKHLAHNVPAHYGSIKSAKNILHLPSARGICYVQDGKARVSDAFEKVGFYEDRMRHNSVFSYIEDRQGRKRPHVVLVTYRMGEDEDIPLACKHFNLTRPFGTVEGFKSNA
eukprot:scaffold10670_cov40-Prasinocladus_malaysianus.AAC.1